MITAANILTALGVAAFTGIVAFFFWLLQKRMSDPITRFEASVDKLERRFGEAITKLERTVENLFKKSDDEKESRFALEREMAKLKASHDERVRLGIGCSCPKVDDDTI